MSPESMSILYIAAGFLFVILFGKALELLVERAAPFFVGKKNGEDLLRNQQHALNIKIDALKIKLEALMYEFHALDTRVETMSSQMAEQLSIVPNSPTFSEGRDALRWRDKSEGQHTEDDTGPKAEIENHSAKQDTWSRPEAVNDEMSVAETVRNRTREDTWNR